MTINPISFRYPFELKNQPPEVVQAHRFAFQQCVDLNQAIAALKSQITNLNQSSTQGGTGGSTSGGTPSAPVPAPPFAFSGLGGLNDQTGSTAYTTVTNDNGALLIFSDASPVAVTLNSALFTPFFLFAANNGAGTVTLTPTTGLINGAASWVLPSSGLFMVVFDGTDWLTSGETPTGVTQIIAGTNVTISPPGGTGAVTINSTGGGSTYLKGTINIGPVGGAGTVTGTGTITGATVGSVVTVGVVNSTEAALVSNLLGWVTSLNNVTIQATFSGASLLLALPVVVFV